MPRALHRPHSRLSPLAHKPPSIRSNDAPPDALEITSSPDTTPVPLPHKNVRRPSTLTTKKTNNIGLPDVIEISSDEDGASQTQESIIADLRRQVRKLKEESAKHRTNCNTLAHEVERYRDELKEVNAKVSEVKPPEGKIILDPLQLEESLNCEICTSRMYSPYLLPDCGHTFCLPCLRDWFGSAHAHFIQANPRWNVDILNGYVARIQGLLRPEYLNHPGIYHRLLDLQQPQPEYTCPTCRKRVLRRPVEVYTLKSLVRSIVAANETEKEDIPPDAPVVERRHGHLVMVDPWSGFFPGER